MKIRKLFGKLLFILGISCSLFACSKPSNNSSFSLPIVPQEPGAQLVESINFRYDSYKVAAGKSLTVRPGILPVDAVYRELYYSSSNKNVFTVNNSGYVVGVEPGEAILTCYALDGSGVIGSTQIITYGVEATSISLNFAEKDCSVGEKFTLDVNYSPLDTSLKKCNFTSSDTSIASVTEDGTVTCLKEGKVTIEATYVTNEAVKASCTLNIIFIETQSFNLSKKNIYLHKGENETLKCKFYPSNATNQDVTYVSDNKNVAEVNQNGYIVAKGLGEATITVTTKDGKFSDYCNVEVFEKNEMIKSSLSYTYHDYFENNIYPLTSAPTIGDVNAVIVPVWFEESENYIDLNKRDGVRTDIENAFFGSDESVGWKSVKNYYKEESHDRFALGGFVTKWFDCGLSVSKFRSESSNSTAELTSVATEWIKRTYKNEDWRTYDKDGNGAFDVFILVYAAPDYSASRNWNDSNLWAYCSWTGNVGKNGNVLVNNFMWASYDFMYGRNTARSKTGHDYGSGHTNNVSVDTHTYIHEFGHILGATDYYDYTQQCTPAGCFSMQDYNVGAHDPYTLMTLGWLDPFIPTKDCQIEIRPTVETGDIILLTDEFNNDNSPFDEYLLVELFSPTGVNEQDAKGLNGYDFTLNTIGVRLWHVDARLLVGNSRNIATNMEFTNNPLTPKGQVYHAIQNTYYYANGEQDGHLTVLGKDYADYNLLQLIRNNTQETYRPRTAIGASDLFHTGDEFSLNKFNKQFKNGEKLNNGNSFSWNLEFISVTGQSAYIDLQKY